ncbi:valine--tRNA ligase [soil metagenome]
METRYDATSAEPKWYRCWEEAGLFQPYGDGEPYCVTIPPPNITGSLHMGHALCYPLQDALGRYQRLRGRKVLILPGQDHAGIAAQSVVDKNLRKQGLSAAAVGREAFVEKVWEWRRESGDTILRQFRALGCAFDWSRTVFTLDEDYASTVLKVFVDWFDRGLIYRGKRVVNWDPKLKTSVSDIETLRQDTRGKLYHVRYLFADGSGDVVIATTRPETMLADVAVAVNPSDERYKALTGRRLRLPLVGRDIPLLADPYPDPTFGTGAVKITPAHDPNDYQVGIRQGLSMPVILDESGRIKTGEIVEHADEKGRAFLETLEGLDRKEAREAIVAELERQGHLVEIEDHAIALIISDRSGEVIEPLLSEQWFCDQPALAKPVIEAMKRGEIEFHPERFDRIFLDWLEGIREWCVSRQLWWGHRIPVYYTEDGTPYAALSWEEAQAKAGDAQIVRQEEDVLDTWFSSGLWPFATLGWPNETEDFKTFYPTSTLITDRNIISLWVARMAMMGYDLTGQKPFDDVMIYATVLNEKGQRMSKSLGTGVDPMAVIEKYGADALRWTLLSQTGENQDLRYSEKRTEEGRNFGTKLWNAVRFVLSSGEGTSGLDPSSLLPVDRWLLSRLTTTEKAVREAYDGYDFQGACGALYRFFWNDLCDWYIEVAKPRLQDPSQAEVPRAVLLTAIGATLKMLHPVMPHLTEELWSHVRPESGLLMASSWPEIPEWFYAPDDEVSVERTFGIIRTLRALRAEAALNPGAKSPLAYADGDLSPEDRELLKSQAWFEEVLPGKPAGRSLVSTSGGVDLYLPVEGLLDPEKESARLTKESEKLTSEIATMRARLDNPQFAERASPEAIAKAKADLAELESKLAKLEERRELFT